MSANSSLPIRDTDHEPMDTSILQASHTLEELRATKVKTLVTPEDVFFDQQAAALNGF
jgi:hypothetical protein